MLFRKGFRATLAAQMEWKAQLPSRFIGLRKSDLLHFTFILPCFTTPVLPKLSKQILIFSITLSFFIEHPEVPLH